MSQPLCHLVFNFSPGFELVKWFYLSIYSSDKAYLWIRMIRTQVYLRVVWHSVQPQWRFWWGYFLHWINTPLVFPIVPLVVIWFASREAVDLRMCCLRRRSSKLINMCFLSFFPLRCTLKENNQISLTVTMW